MTIKVKINIATVDNYLLMLATFLAFVADKLYNPNLALAILIAGAIVKAIGSALIEGETIGQNLDNVALACGAALAAVIGYFGTATTYVMGAYSVSGVTIAFYVMVAAYMLKAVGSAYVRGDSISQNLDNIALAAVSTLAVIFPAYGFYLLAFATVLKAMGSNGLRGIVTAAEQVISSLPNASTAPTPTTSQTTAT